MTIKRIAAVVAGCAAAGLITGVTAAPAEASAGSYLVIASSPSTERWAWAIRREESDAIQVAIGQCSKYGARDCDWVASTNHGCAAYARRSDGRGNGGTGDTLWAAERDARLKNGGGWIVVSKCLQVAAPRQKIDDNQ